MSTIIKIKNSGVSGSPSALATGELAYSYLTGTQVNGGDRLYIGTGTEDITGAAANIEVIGGTYFTSKLDHTPGTLTASSALIVDADSKIDIFNVDNLRLDGNTLSSTNANGDITLAPNGVGEINLNATVINLNGTTSLTGDIELSGDTLIGGSLTVEGQSTLASLNVQDLTNNRVLIAGVDGEVEDDINFTFDGTTFNLGQGNFTVTQASGNTQIAGTLDVDGQTTLASLNVEDLTKNRILIVGNSGELIDSADLTFNGSLFAIGSGNTFTVNPTSGDTEILGTLNVNGQSTLNSLNVEDLTSGRVTFAGDFGELVDSNNFTFNTATNTLTLTGDQDITGSLDVDNININGNTISVTNANGNLEFTPNALGLTIINSATALTLPVGNTASRPATPTTGMIRYNSTDSRYEGYSSGAWQGLGGVVDVDQDTYVRAESSPGADNDDLEFYTAGTKRINLDENGMVFTDTSIPLQVGSIVLQTNTISTTSGGTLYLDPNPVGSEGTVVIEGNLQVNGITTTINSTEMTVIDPVIILGGVEISGGTPTEYTSSSGDDYTNDFDTSTFGVSWDGTHLVVNPTVWTNSTELNALIALASGTTISVLPGGWFIMSATLTSAFVQDGSVYKATVSGALADNNPIGPIDQVVFTSGGSSSATDDNRDRGVAFNYASGGVAKLGFFGWDDSAERFTFIADATENTSIFSGAASNIKVANTLLDSITFTAGNYTTTSVMATDGSGNVIFVNEDSANVYGTEGQVLQMNSSGVPSFGHIDCGTY